MTDMEMMKDMISGSIGLIKYLRDELHMDERSACGALAICLVFMCKSVAEIHELIDAAEHDMKNLVGDNWAILRKDEPEILN